MVIASLSLALRCDWVSYPGHFLGKPVRGRRKVIPTLIRGDHANAYTSYAHLGGSTANSRAVAFKNSSFSILSSSCRHPQICFEVAVAVAVSTIDQRQRGGFDTSFSSVQDETCSCEICSNI